MEIYEQFYRVADERHEAWIVLNNTPLWRVVKWNRAFKNFIKLVEEQNRLHAIINKR